MLPFTASAARFLEFLEFLKTTQIQYTLATAYRLQLYLNFFFFIFKANFYFLRPFKDEDLFTIK